MISAEVRSDDYLYVAQFDATKWFEQASDKDILKLADCGWGGDYPGDQVAYFFSDQVDEIKLMLDYCERTQDSFNSVGFECHVTSEEAIEWIKQNRPALMEQLGEEI